MSKQAAAQPENFLKGFVEALGQNKKLVKSAHQASERLLKARNGTKGHGYIVPDAQYRQLLNEYAEDLRSFLNLAGLLARYTLMKPLQPHDDDPPRDKSVSGLGDDGVAHGFPHGVL